MESKIIEDREYFGLAAQTAILKRGEWSFTSKLRIQQRKVREYT